MFLIPYYYPCISWNQIHCSHLHMQTSSVEIERVCNRADERLLETAAVSIKPAGGGPEHLAILAVLKDRSAQYDVNLLKSKFQKAIQKNLNPLFKVKHSLFCCRGQMIV